MAELTSNFDDAFGLVCAACQRRLTTPELIREAMAKRVKLRWRADLADALGDIASGTHSLLEYRYLRRVERAHHLPEAARQFRTGSDGRNRYLDNLYRDYGLCVELDGKQAHPDDQRWLDQRRANAIAAQGIRILRYDWTDVDRRPCETAAQVAVVLHDLGWPGTAWPCGTRCAVGQPTVQP